MEIIAIGLKLSSSSDEAFLWSGFMIDVFRILRKQPDSKDVLMMIVKGFTIYIYI